MQYEEIVDWLLEGDVAVQYQTQRDLLGNDDPKLQQKIAFEGWGAQFLKARNPDGGWGRAFYQIKWTSGHYTLLDLKNIGLSPDTASVKHDIADYLSTEISPTDGGIGPFGPKGNSDVCVNGMFLNYACYFGVEETSIKSIVDFLLAEQMGDGGFNCRSNRAKPKHSSLHSTCSVIEGFTSYLQGGYQHRPDEVRHAMEQAIEFMLLHQLFISDRTGEIIDKKFLQLTFPARWKYNVLRGMDALRAAKVTWDPRMQAAIDVLQKKRRPDGRWNAQAKHSGETHFNMERAGRAGRWNTLMAMRVFKRYGVE